MPYKPPKMTPKAASRARAKGYAVARTRTTLRTPGTVVSKGMDPLAMPVRVGVSTLASLAEKTSAGKYAPKYGTSGPRSLPEYKASVKAAFKEKKNPTKSQWTEDNPRTRVIKAYAKAPFEKNRNTKPPTTNAQAAAKMRANAAAAAKARATKAKAKASPRKRK